MINVTNNRGTSDCGSTAVSISKGCVCIFAPKPKLNSGRTRRNATSSNRPPKGKISDPNTSVHIADYGNLCASQIGNIQKLEEKQRSLDSKEVAVHSVLSSAINQMNQVECGIVLKNVECKNNNCNFEWSAKGSNLNETKTQASVKRFNQAVVEEEKEKAEANKAMDELIQLGADVFFDIIDAIDQHQQTKQARQQSSERFTPTDNDNDGLPDALVEDAPGGGQNLYMDTNGDGKADKIARIDKSGKTTYENIPEGKQFSMQGRDPDNAPKPDFVESLTDTNAPPSTWEDFYKRQRVKPGEDGYMTIVAPDGKAGDLSTFQSDEKTYFINGIQNSFSDATASAQLLANTVNQPVVLVYSAEDGLWGDLQQASVFQMRYGSTAASTNMGQSLIYDLLEDRQVTLYAHSRGATISYQLAHDIASVFQSVGADDKLRNLTIITVGGFAPEANKWPVNVLAIQHENDPIPPLGGNGMITEFPNHAFHSFESYLNEIVDYNFNRERRK